MYWEMCLHYYSTACFDVYVCKLIKLRKRLPFWLLELKDELGSFSSSQGYHRDGICQVLVELIDLSHVWELYGYHWNAALSS